MKCFTMLSTNLKSNSIWGCLEIDALSRDFNYDDYVDLHTKTGCVGALVSRHIYSLLDTCFYLSMVENALDEVKEQEPPMDF